MTKAIKNLLFVLGILCLACNPECDQLLTINIDSTTKQSESEILITSNSPELIEGKEIIFATADKRKTAKLGTYVEALNGVVVSIPPDIQGEDIQILIDDPDCGLIAFDKGLSIVDGTFFQNNTNFIPPAPLEIVIPTPPISFPPLVQNAWISPQDLDYCIWFKFLPELDMNGDTVKVEVNGMMVPKESNILDPYTSKEFSVGELVCSEPNVTFYHNNPVYGVLDKEENFINFWIDRTNIQGQNLGIEEFEGSFIDIDKAGYMDEKTPDCNPGIFEPQKKYLILVTSKQTGRQLLMYQQEFL